MQPDYERSAAAMVDGTHKAIAAAVAPLLKRIEALESRPLPERGEKGDRGEQGIAGRDGVGVRDGFVQREGILVLTLSDGTTRDFGVVVGKDGVDGKDGEAGPQGERGERGEQGPQGEKGDRGDIGLTGEKGIDGRDGADGRDGLNGRDGFSVDQLDIVPHEDGRTIDMKFLQGDKAYNFELVLPIPIYRGVFKADHPYACCDRVTWGGSEWQSEKDNNTSKPGTNEDWTLAIKKGRDGKDAKAA